MPVNRFNHTSWMALVTPTDRPKSVCNRCVIEVFGEVFVLSIGFRIFCLYRGFCHMTESNPSFSLFSEHTGNAGNTGLVFQFEFDDPDENLNTTLCFTKLNVTVLKAEDLKKRTEKVLDLHFCEYETQSNEHSFELFCRHPESGISMYDNCKTLDRRAWNEILNECTCSYEQKQEFKQLCESDGSIVFEKEDIKEPGVLGGVCVAIASSGEIKYTVLAIVTNMSPPYPDGQGQTKRLYRAVKMTKISQLLKEAEKSNTA